MAQTTTDSTIIKIGSLISGSIAVSGIVLSSLYSLYLLLLGSSAGFLIGGLSSCFFVLLLISSVKVRKMKKWTLYFFSFVAVISVLLIFISHNFNNIYLILTAFAIIFALYLLSQRNKFI